MRRVERLLLEARQLRILRATRVRQAGPGSPDGDGDDGEAFFSHMRVAQRICSDLMEASEAVGGKPASDVEVSGFDEGDGEASGVGGADKRRRVGPVDVIDPALLAPVIDGIHAGFEAFLSPVLRAGLFDAFNLAATRRLHPGGVEVLLAGRAEPGNGDGVDEGSGNGAPRAGDRARRSALDDVVQLALETCVLEALRRYCLEADAQRAVSSYVDASDIEVAGDRVAKRRPVKPRPKTKGQLNAERSFGRFWKKRDGQDGASAPGDGGAGS